MRHFAQELRDKGLPLQYHFLQDEQFRDLAEALAHTINIQQPEEVWFVRPSDYRVFECLVNTCKLLLCLMEEKILKSVIDKSLQHDKVRESHWYLPVLAMKCSPLNVSSVLIQPHLAECYLTRLRR
jgi:deoxyribodipyrimidine photolyase-like uncharacterized protein